MTNQELLARQRQVFETLSAWATTGTFYALPGAAAIVERRDGDFLARLSGQRDDPVMELELMFAGETIAFFNFHTEDRRLDTSIWNAVLANERFNFPPETPRH